MASNLTISIGPISASVSFGAASDATIGAKVKEWAIGVGIATVGDSNQQVADHVAVYVRDQLRERVKQWHISQARTTFEQTSAVAGDAYLDTE